MAKIEGIADIMKEKSEKFSLNPFIQKNRIAVAIPIKTLNLNPAATPVPSIR
jgi:hypothetical protein